MRGSFHAEKISLGLNRNNLVNLNNRKNKVMSGLSSRYCKILFILISFFVAPSIYTKTYCQILSKTRNLIWYTPSEVQKINGIAIGPFESSILGKQQIVNGLTFSIVGMGVFYTITEGHNRLDRYFYDIQKNIGEIEYEKLLNERLVEQDSLIRLKKNNYLHNGLVIGGAGMLSDKVNGVSIGSLANYFEEVNGLIVSGIVNNAWFLKGVSIACINESYYFKGIQIGIFNRTIRQRGIQIGLWNRNLRRSLPFINWSFN